MNRLSQYKVIATGEGEVPELGPGTRRWVALQLDDEGGWVLQATWAYQTWWYVQNYGTRVRGEDKREVAARLCPHLDARRFRP